MESDGWQYRVNREIRNYKTTEDLAMAPVRNA